MRRPLCEQKNEANVLLQNHYKTSLELKYLFRNDGKNYL